MDLHSKIETEILENLNPVQKEAVLHDRGPLLILAGAGSGKTRVITSRIAYLCRIRNVKPWKIAAVTFTNKAALEMGNRLQKMIGPMANECTVKTFHSLGLYILRRNAAELGIKSNFSVYDQSAQVSLIKQILKERKVDIKMITPESVGNAINHARDAMISPESYVGGFDDYSKEVAAVYPIYIRRLRQNNALDFGDLIFETVRLLEKNEDVLDHYQEKWFYFHIDEYQDTNHAQYKLGRLISRKYENIVVVGDDDQSIYSWRGADIRNILDFEKDYQSTKVLKLVENYRSTKDILACANELISHNTKRRPKEMFTSAKESEKVKFIEYNSDIEEAEGIANSITRLSNQGMELRDMAICYRTNAQSRQFEEVLRRKKIPHVLIGGFRFYDRAEIKDMIAYLNVVENPADSLSLERIINTPPRGIGDVALNKLYGHSFGEKISLLEAAGDAESLPGIRSAKNARRIYERFQDWILLKESHTPSAIASAVLLESGYLDYLQADSSPEGESRLENIQEFINSIKEYELRTDSPTLSDFLQNVALATSEADPGVDTDCLQLMTLHNAKGLEFEAVFLCGFEEGYIPHSLSIEDGDLEEERRLLYVGITRAKKKLAISSSRFRRIFGAMQPRLVSRFKRELPDVDERRSSMNAEAGWTRASQGFGQSKQNTEDTFAIGDRVRHARYGVGTVQSVENAPVGSKLRICFDEDGSVKLFLTQYTPLSKMMPSG